MDQPRARVVGLEGDDDVPIGRQQDHVAARRVDPLQLYGGGVPLLARGLLEDGEVVAVKMDLLGTVSIALGERRRGYSCRMRPSTLACGRGTSDHEIDLFHRR